MDVKQLSVNDAIDYIAAHAGQYGTPGINANNLVIALKAYFEDLDLSGDSPHADDQQTLESYFEEV